MVSPGELQVVTRLVADVADLDLTLHVPPGGAPLSRHHASSESPPGLCAGAMRLFRLAAAAQVVVVSKHLCGCATDFALRCVASSTPPRRLLLATCCHHRCTFADYAGRPFLLAVGVSREEFEARYTLRPSPPSGLLISNHRPSDPCLRASLHGMPSSPLGTQAMCTLSSWASIDIKQNLEKPKPAVSSASHSIPADGDSWRLPPLHELAARWRCDTGAAAARGRQTAGTGAGAGHKYAKEHARHLSSSEKFLLGRRCKLLLDAG